jgi:nucleoid DNA-binding protein
MTKQDIVKSIVQNVYKTDGTRYKKEEINEILNYAINIMKHSLRNKDKVVIRSFGAFVVRHKNPKAMINNHTGERIMTRERDHVHFTMAKDFDLNSMV